MLSFRQSILTEKCSILWCQGRLTPYKTLNLSWHRKSEHLSDQIKSFGPSLAGPSQILGSQGQDFWNCLIFLFFIFLKCRVSKLLIWLRGVRFWGVRAGLGMNLPWRPKSEYLSGNSRVWRLGIKTNLKNKNSKKINNADHGSPGTGFGQSGRAHNSWV